MGADDRPGGEQPGARGPVRPWSRPGSRWVWLGALAVAGVLVVFLLLAFAGEDDELVVHVPAGADVMRFDPDDEVRVSGTLRDFGRISVFDPGELEDFDLDDDVVLVARTIAAPDGDGAIDVDQVLADDLPPGRQVTVTGQVGTILGPRTFTLVDD